MLALQNCITTSRTVTFILQSNKNDIPNFDSWYQRHVERWSADPILKWAKEARNSIEKRGDLETHSQVRAELIAGYLPGPETEWMPQYLFDSPRAIWRSVPSKYFIPHVVENGTLLIERRWVDSNLPNTEVLEALAHVYDDFCSTIIDLLQVNGIPIPPQLDRTRPNPMGELAMDRAIYLSMRDGSVTGLRYFKKPMKEPSELDKKKLAKRYGNNVSRLRLTKATTLREVAEFFFENARVVMARDGNHSNFTFLLRGNFPIEMVRSDHPDRASRYLLMRDLAKLARVVDANGVMMIGEVWTAHGDDLPKSGFAADAKNRGEAIMVSAANAQGELVHITAEVTRMRFRPQKVRSVGPPHVETDGFTFFLAPFLQQWGVTDKEAMQRAFSQMDAMGIEIPRVV